MSDKVRRFLFAGIGIGGLILVYLFQRTNVAEGIGMDSYTDQFIFNRSLRFILNDLFAIVLIYGLFLERKFVIFAIYVQLFGLLFILIPYFLLRFNWPESNGPMISFLHRLVLNPILLLLLIPSFYYQRIKEGRN
jgi:exosortase F-associated protein